jgi:hypothetical protein
MANDPSRIGNSNPPAGNRPDPYGTSPDPYGTSPDPYGTSTDPYGFQTDRRDNDDEKTPDPHGFQTDRRGTTPDRRGYRSPPVDIPPGPKKTPRSSESRSLEAFLARKRCRACGRTGLQAVLGMVYRKGMSAEESIVCADCEDSDTGDGTPYSAWKIEGLRELFACGYFRRYG